MAIMLSVALRTSLEILLLRRGPQDMPSSWQLFYTAVGSYVLINVASMMLGTQWLFAVVNVGVLTAVLVLYCHWLLKRTGKEVRFAQTVTALAACSAWLSLLAIPCLLGLQPFLETVSNLPKDASTLPPLPLLPALGYVVISLWNLMVMGHVLRHALDTTMGRGILLALLYELLLFFVVQLVAGLLMTGMGTATAPVGGG